MPTPQLSSRRVWALPLISVVGAAGLAFGCAQVLGVDEEYALSPTDTPDAADTGPPPVFIDAADVVAPIPDAGDPDACTPTQKRCDGVCVPKSEPKYGCGASTCTPCSLPNTEATKCNADGLCEFGTCKLGFRACGAPTAGCTTNLSEANTCGDCNKSCQGGEVCNPGGCSTVCDPGLTKCDQSCVDTTTSVLHCGPKGADNGPSCSNICPTAANGDPACVAGSCIIACRAGFSHCDGTLTGPCVTQSLFYQDLDGDGWGDVAVSKFACNQTEAGAGWIARPGDCNDTNKDVFPMNPRYFPDPYVSKTGQASYDYNCDGNETELPNVVHFSPCTEKCTESGIGPSQVQRSGGNVNPYCGSTSQLQCMGTVMTPMSPSADPLVQCGITNKVGPPNPCH